ncbi:hypothetical protein YC2023_075690 [Brassica napus]
MVFHSLIFAKVFSTFIIRASRLNDISSIARFVCFKLLPSSSSSLDLRFCPSSWSTHFSSLLPPATIAFFFSVLIPITPTSSSHFCLVSGRDRTVSTIPPLAPRGGSEELLPLAELRTVFFPVLFPVSSCCATVSSLVSIF